MPKKLKTLKRSESEEEEEKYLRKAAVEVEEYVDHEYLQEDEYNVETIEDMKIENGKKVYLIKWDGFPHSQNTWEPIEHLTKVLYMVEQFEENYAMKKSMQDNNNYSYGIQDDQLETLQLKKKKTKKFEIQDPEEAIVKKRKLDATENGNQVYEKRIVGIESPKGDDFGLRDEGIMEISYDKENFDKPQKKRFTKNFFEKAAPIEDNFQLPKENSFLEFDARIFHDSSLNDDPFRFLEKSAPEKENVFSAEKDIVNLDLNKEITMPEITTTTPVESKTVPSKSIKEILQKKQQKKINSNFSNKSLPKKKDKTGSFRNKDKPNRILSIKPGKDGGLLFLVEWQRRNEGLFPENSYVTNEEMKLNDPYFLIDFYESKLVRKQKHKKKNKDKENENVEENKMEVEKEQNVNTETAQETLTNPISPPPVTQQNEEQAPSLNDSHVKDKMLEDLENEMVSYEGNLDGNSEVLEGEIEKNQGKDKANSKAFGSTEKITASSENGGNENREGNDQENNQAQGSLVSVGS